MTALLSIQTMSITNRGTSNPKWAVLRRSLLLELKQLTKEYRLRFRMDQYHSNRRMLHIRDQEPTKILATEPPYILRRDLGYRDSSCRSLRKLQDQVWLVASMTAIRSISQTISSQTQAIRHTRSFLHPLAEVTLRIKITAPSALKEDLSQQISQALEAQEEPETSTRC